MILVTIIANVEFYYKVPFSGLLTDFGSFFGLSIFLILLGAIGFFLSWDSKEKIKMGHLFLLVFFALVFILDNAVLIYLNPAICVFAAYGINFLVKKKWNSRAIRNITLFLVLLSFIFSTVSYEMRIKDYKPNNELFDSLKFLSEQAKGIVVANPDYAGYITYFGMQPLFEHPKLYREKKQIDYNHVLSLREFDKFKIFLETNKVKYILVDEETPTTFLSVLENSKFTVIYKNSKIKIYRY